MALRREQFFFILLSLFLLSGISNAQDQRVADSLLVVLEELPRDDSSKIALLIGVSFNHNDPAISVDYALKVLELAQKKKDFGLCFRAYYLIGTAENKRGNLGNAVEAFTKASLYAEKIDSKGKLGQTYLSLGDVYSNQENHDNALIYYRKAIEVLKIEPEDISYITAMLNMGFEYYRIDQVDSALFYFAKSKNIFESIDYEIGALYCLGNLGLAYAKKSDYSLAEKNIQEAISKLTVYEDYYAISDFEKEMADIYRVKKNYPKAIEHATSSLHMAEENGLKIQTRDATQVLYQIYKELGDFELANGYLEEYYVLRDSIINTENIKRIADLRTEYEVGQKQAEVDVLTAQSRTERVLLAAVTLLSIILLVFGVIVYGYYKQKSKTNQELERLNQTKDKFFSIISHDLRGPVSSFMGISRLIKFLVKSKETDQLLEVADDIDESVDRLSELLDNLLNWAMQQRGHFPNVPEKVNLALLSEDLIRSLATMARGKNIDLHYKVDDRIDLWVDRNTTMTIFRNLVNNALKFTPEGGEVLVSASLQGEVAEIRISDTGVGIPADKLAVLFEIQDKKSTYGTAGEKGLGLGLQLVYEFIEMNRGEVRVESEVGKGTVFIVKLPLYESQTEPINV